MPSINTVVADFQNGSLTGIGAMPEMNGQRTDKVISDTCRVKYKFVHMIASLNGTTLSCVEAAASISFNGSYLFFEDDWSTVANMDVHRLLVVSGKFSGCMWKVFRTQQHQYKCVHIARSGGPGANALVNLVTNGTAVNNQWVEVQSMQTGHLIGGGANEVVVVSQYFPAHQRIDSIALALNNNGQVVNSVFQSNPA